MSREATIQVQSSLHLILECNLRIDLSVREFILLCAAWVDSLYDFQTKSLVIYQLELKAPA